MTLDEGVQALQEYQDDGVLVPATITARTKSELQFFFTWNHQIAELDQLLFPWTQPGTLAPKRIRPGLSLCAEHDFANIPSPADKGIIWAEKSSYTETTFSTPPQRLISRLLMDGVAYQGKANV